MPFVTDIYNAILEFILKILNICKIDTSNLPDWLKPIEDAE